MAVFAIHRVLDRPERDHDIGWAEFRSLLDQVEAARHAVSVGTDQSTLAGGHVALPFDDADGGPIFEVAQELDRRRMRGIFFVPAGRLDKRWFLTSRSYDRSMNEDMV